MTTFAYCVKIVRGYSAKTRNVRKLLMDGPLFHMIPEIAQTPEMTTQEYAYARLRSAIMVGDFAPGHKMTIRGLAQDLNLSQTPIRESVRRLSSEGAIEVLGNRRLRIPEMTLSRFDQLIQVRTVLEVHAAQSCLPYVSDVIIDKMAEIDGKLDELVRDQDAAGLTRLNQAFHKFLYSLNSEQVIMPLIESIWLQLGPFQRVLMASGQHYYSIDRHKEILSALRERNANALTTALKADIHDGLVRIGKEVLKEK